MKIATEFVKGKLVIRLHGEIDHHAARGLIENICSDIDKCLPKVCVLDMKDVGFMDSSGIAVLVKAYKRMKELGGELRVLNVCNQCRRVLEMSGLEKIICMEDIKR